MEKLILSDNLLALKKQRNLFLLISCVLLTSNFLLALCISRLEQSVILVPGIRSEMTVSKSGVSKNYLEEMSLLFLSNLLDLTQSDIQHKKELIMKYTVGDESAIKELLNYFQIAARDYTRFGLSTFFTTKHLDIDLENLTVTASGILTSYYGKNGHNTEHEEYVLSFEYQRGNLRLKSFSRLMSDAKKAKEKMRLEKLETEINHNLGSNLSHEDIKLLDLGHPNSNSVSNNKALEEEKLLRSNQESQNSQNQIKSQESEDEDDRPE